MLMLPCAPHASGSTTRPPQEANEDSTDRERQVDQKETSGVHRLRGRGRPGHPRHCGLLQ